MKANRDQDLARAFDDALRLWGRQSPCIHATVARARVLAALSPTPPRNAWLRLAAVAATLLVLLVAVWRSMPRPASKAGGRTGAVARTQLHPNVVLWVVDSKTTVYFVLSPGGSTKGDMS